MTREPWMEVLPATGHCFSSPNWSPGQAPARGSGGGGGARWTREENKLFEEALARYEHGAPNRWQQVAEAIPGKTVDDVVSHYEDLELDVQQIEAGFVPQPGHSVPSFTLDWEGGGRGLDGWRRPYHVPGKRPGGRGADQERKKGVLWTEDEHRLFLLGLKKYGKGDWRNISRNFVLTRTPTQVASHAQKYYLRLNSGCKDKKRSSIHDITTVSLTDGTPPSPSNSSSVLTPHSTVPSPPAIPNQFSLTIDMNPSIANSGNPFSRTAQTAGYGMAMLDQNPNCCGGVPDQSMLFHT